MPDAFYELLSRLEQHTTRLHVVPHDGPGSAGSPESSGR
jgi:hypothetical protein